MRLSGSRTLVANFEASSRIAAPVGRRFLEAGQLRDLRGRQLVQDELHFGKGAVVGAHAEVPVFEERRRKSVSDGRRWIEDPLDVRAPC
jgi:hypothetical protein